MAVKAMYAVMHCDRCGNEFSVPVDLTMIPAPGWSLREVAVDAARANCDCKQNHVASIRGGYMVCADCLRNTDGSVLTIYTILMARKCHEHV